MTGIFLTDPITLSVAIPALGALLIALGSRSPNLRETMTLLTATALAVNVYTLLPDVLAGGRPATAWFSILPGIEMAFRIEPLGMLFAAVASLLWIVNSVYSIGYMRGNREHKQTRFYVCFALAIAATMGIAFAGNLLTLFFFYEALTLVTYPLVTHKGNDEARKAGRVYLGILIGTSIGFQLLAILWVYASTGSGTFGDGGLIANSFTGAPVGLLLMLFIYGIGKAAVMPVHRWLPAAMVAPTPVSALLHAVAVVKAGVFSVIKVAVYVFGLDLLAREASADWLFYAAAFTVIAASIVALRQDNLKRRLAYSTISQLSYVVLAVSIYNPIALAGAAIHIAAHAFGKITLFFAAGSIYTAGHKTEISQLDGIGKRMPITMIAFAIGSFSMIGLPLTAGFVSKWYMLSGAYAAQHYLAIAVIVVSTLLNAAYFLPVIHAAFFRKESAESAAHPHGEAPLPILLALVTTASLTVALFLYPDPAIALAKMLAGI